jgi:hypothetical protein
VILENILPYHIHQTKLYGVVFDNTIKYDSNRKFNKLKLPHFIHTNVYYKLTFGARSITDDSVSDEELLFSICRTSGLKFKPNAIGMADFLMNKPNHGFDTADKKESFIGNAYFNQKLCETTDTANDFTSLIFPKSNKKYVIYTCQTGNYDSTYDDNVFDTDLFDYYYFTDTPSINVDKRWMVIDIRKFDFIFPQKIENDNVRKARFIKTHPHLFFKNYERSIWVDANMHFMVSPKILIDNIDKRFPFTSVKHPVRICIYQEANEVIRLKKDDPVIINDEMELLKHNCYPSNNGLVESGLIIRDHNNDRCISVMEQWWLMIEHYSRRDQLSFDYVCWKNNFGYNAMPIEQRRKITKCIRHQYEIK